jgi:predicted DNA-binding WGR domain protein
MRYFEFVGEDTARKSEQASKFWEMEVSGKTISVRFGKIGTNGQIKVKSFETEIEASEEAANLIKQKVKKGYIEK